MSLAMQIDTIQWLSPAGLHRLAYRQWGDPDNPHVLLCVHGLTRNGLDFETLAQHLAPTVRVVAPDMPGRGQSDWLPNPALYNVPTYLNAIIPLLARLKARQLDWLGTSMGGLIGMTLCGLSSHPINKLILNDVGPALNFQALERIGQYVGQPTAFATFSNAVEHIKRIHQPFGPHSQSQWEQLTRYVVQEKNQQWILHYDPNIAHAFQQLSAEHMQQNEAQLWQLYDNIQIPTLLIRGEDSDLLSEKTASSMTQRGPKAQLIQAQRVGHAPTLMQIEQINWIKAFITK
jgi:pimeloyl-ACP methyl ester carboxylesterase